MPQIVFQKGSEEKAGMQATSRMHRGSFLRSGGGSVQGAYLDEAEGSCPRADGPTQAVGVCSCLTVPRSTKLYAFSTTSPLDDIAPHPHFTAV